MVTSQRTIQVKRWANPVDACDFLHSAGEDSNRSREGAPMTAQVARKIFGEPAKEAIVQVLLRNKFLRSGWALLTLI